MAISGRVTIGSASSFRSVIQEWRSLTVRGRVRVSTRPRLDCDAEIYNAQANKQNDPYEVNNNLQSFPSGDGLSELSTLLITNARFMMRDRVDLKTGNNNDDLNRDSDKPGDKMNRIGRRFDIEDGDEGHQPYKGRGDDIDLRLVLV